MKLVLTLAAMISFTIVANLLMKTGATASVSHGAVAGLLNWRTLLGLASFAIAALLYSLLLRWLPLSMAQSFASLQFVGVILASALVLSEPISAGQWFGIGLIALGIVAVGLARG